MTKVGYTDFIALVIVAGNKGDGKNQWDVPVLNMQRSL